MDRKEEIRPKCAPPRRRPTRKDTNMKDGEVVDQGDMLEFSGGTRHVKWVLFAAWAYKHDWILAAKSETDAKYICPSGELIIVNIFKGSVGSVYHVS